VANFDEDDPKRRPDSSRPSVERFSGFASDYDQYRPRPPSVVMDVLTQFAQLARPVLVVDLGCGTGLSTRIWADRARKVIGVEPSDDMRRQAEQRTTAMNVSYRRGLSHETGLPDACADIVTCSQALHWMEPDSTLAEVARILRPGGVFAACDCDWPPTTPHWQADLAFRTLLERVGKLANERRVDDGLKRWHKEQHLGRIRACGHFRYAKEVLLHGIEMGNADRLVGLALTFGSLMNLLKSGMTESEIGLDALREVARATLGDKPLPWYFSYRVKAGIR